MLQIEHRPIEAGLAAQLDRQRRSQVREHADQRLAGADTGTEIGHVEMMPGPQDSRVAHVSAGLRIDAQARLNGRSSGTKCAPSP